MNDKRILMMGDRWIYQNEARKEAQKAHILKDWSKAVKYYRVLIQEEPCGNDIATWRSIEVNR